MLYTETQTATLHEETFAYLRVAQAGHVLTITLNRPEKKNALNPVMVNELAFALYYARYQTGVWLVVIQAAGDVFCAGADLKAFLGQTETHHSTIPEPAGEVLIGELFNQLNKPTIAKVEGDVYAGGFLLLAGCTFVVACNDVRLGLPEVKRGLFPFQVMAGLMEVMPPRMVLDWCIRGYDLQVERAHEFGLISQVTIREDIDREVDNLVREILANSPTAIRMGMEAYHRLRHDGSAENHEYLRNMLMQTLQTRDAQEGLRAFREKRSPQWTGE